VINRRSESRPYDTYETPAPVAPFSSNLASDVFDLTAYVEEEARDSAEAYNAKELARIQPLLLIGKPLTDTDSCTTAQEFRDRDIDILLSLKYASEIQAKYRSFPFDTKPLVDFVEGFKQQLIKLLSNSPKPQYLN